MREENYGTDNHGHNFLTGMLCGVAIGAAVGLLLAPKAGSELRHQIADTTSRLRRSASHGYAVAADKVSHIVDDVVTRGKQAVHHGQETYEQVRHSADDAAQAATKAINKARA